jgi:hypothetical protein
MLRIALIAAFATLLAGCAGSDERVTGGGDLDVESVRAFAGYPVYWVGERFEKWELVHADIGASRFANLVYGRCEIDDPDGPFGPEGGSCVPPLEIQIQPLCVHLPAVAAAPIWKRRHVRGAPVGTIDSAPVLLTNRVQVKVYRGQGSDPGLPMRVLRALYSANSVPPVLEPGDPVPPAPRSMLEGEEPCRD